MHQELSIPQIPLKTTSSQVILDDYAELLNRRGLEYKEFGYQLQVGDISGTQGWILHVSVVRWQFIELMELILPTLLSAKAPFRMIKDKESLRSVLDGGYGYSQVGKALSIYPGSDQTAIYIAQTLIEITKEYKGPRIPTDAYLGGNVYARYGAFNPIYIIDVSGRSEPHIYSENGELIRDTYFIPFKLPAGVPWPFDSISTLEERKEKKVLNRLYKPMHLLKTDPKGNVWKGLYVKGFLHVKWCVIKQGRRDMWSNEVGHALPHRLGWQKAIYDELHSEIRLPKIIDLFEECEDGYIVMEYIKGISLIHKVWKINSNCSSWHVMSKTFRRSILSYIIQVIKILTKIHGKGIVHRDITPVNFLVDKNEQLVLIDNELAYSLKWKKPTLPYIAGTHGFMSPEQIEVKTPTPKEDIYGLGATMIAVLVNLPPLMLNIKVPILLQKKILTFIENEALAKLISRCLDPDPFKRPGLDEIYTAVTLYYDSLVDEGKKCDQSSGTARLNITSLEQLIQKGINGLVEPPTVTENKIWCSKVSSRDKGGSNNSEFMRSVGLYEGITGVLYFLGKAKEMNFDIGPCLNSYKKGWDYIERKALEPPLKIDAGLYGGGAGIALALATGIRSGILENSEKRRNVIAQCISLESGIRDLAAGSAGQVIALMKCKDYLDSGFYDQLMAYHIGKILSSKNDIGAWIWPKSKRRFAIETTSFAFGNTGIIWVLLEYVRINNDLSVKQQLIEPLMLLLKFKKKVRSYITNGGIRQALTAGGLQSDCITGIILTLCKAYEVFNDPVYKLWAEEVLNEFPACAVCENLSQDTGLAGVGEIYLEAYRVFKNEKWRDRANWLATLFSNLANSEYNDYAYWLIDNSEIPTADLLTGSSGILYFLIRCLHMNNVDNNMAGYRVLA